jgi:hypothetical protein
MRLQQIIPLFLALAVVGCKAETDSYHLSTDQILSLSKKLPGEVYMVSGDKTGPFMAGPRSVGNHNTKGSFHIRTHDGNQPGVEWPAVEDFYFEAQSYIDPNGKALYIVRKIPFLKER